MHAHLTPILIVSPGALEVRTNRCAFEQFGKPGMGIRIAITIIKYFVRIVAR